MRTNETFEQHLRKSNLSENTIHSYLWTVNFYHAHYDEVNKENLLAYKGYLMEFFKPKTVNLRIQAMNKFLEKAAQEGRQYGMVLRGLVSGCDRGACKRTNPD